MKKVLFLCTGNSCRSQMAEGVARERLGDIIEVFSAGTNPTGLNSKSVAVMNEIGIDISGQSSKVVDEFVEADLDLVITLCGDARDNCPVFPGRTEVVHIGFIDPARTEGTYEEVMSVFRKVRDEIAEQIPAYLTEKFSL